ncbi:hypothetical protein HM131_16055 [Halobacillus mangrovi]|uniref:Uncharacterized protein n=1 Tax=Halobacillus mangrovi TaxID=402384 RepID=A0A1W5ZY33_9BACI|nr:hypothetical protein HM131_16055 [Halobacillus mangrovi]
MELNPMKRERNETKIIIRGNFQNYVYIIASNWNFINAILRKNHKNFDWIIRKELLLYKFHNFLNIEA